MRKEMIAKKIVEVWGDEALYFRPEKLKLLYKQAEAVIRLTNEETNEER